MRIRVKYSLYVGYIHLVDGVIYCQCFFIFCLYNSSISENEALKSLGIIMLVLICGFMRTIVCSLKLSVPRFHVHIFRMSMSS